MFPMVLLLSTESKRNYFITLKFKRKTWEKVLKWAEYRNLAILAAIDGVSY